MFFITFGLLGVVFLSIFVVIDVAIIGINPVETVDIINIILGHALLSSVRFVTVKDNF
jgi:hypothetical protein